MHYLEFLRRLHDELQPAGYLEIGVDWGDSLQLSRARSVAIDPAPKPRPESFLGKPGLILYAGTSDDFFGEQRREAMLGDAPLDLAFIDGLHEFSQVVRDLEHVERWSHAGTVAAIHDVLPRDVWEAAHVFHDGFWTGDVWRVVPFLRQHRPDLRLCLTAAEPTGMLIVTGFNPDAAGMADLAAMEDATFPGPGPEYDRLVNEFIAESAAEPAERVVQMLSLDRRVEGGWGYDAKWGMQMVAEASWRPVLEAAAASPGTPHHERGMRACLRLIGAHWLPAGVREEAYGHLAQYASPLTALWPDASLSTLALPGAKSRLMTSPAPVAVSGELVATVQLSAADGQGRSWGLLRLDDELAVQSAELLSDETRGGEGAPEDDSSIEQVQPFVQDGRLRAIATVSDRNPRGVAQAGLVAIADGALRELRLLSDAGNRRHERNWAPFVTEAGLLAISCWEPTETLRIEGASDDGDGEAARRVALRPAPRLAERWQGASAGIAVPDGWLFLVNEVADAPGIGPPPTFARFVLFNADFRVAAVSPHFWVSARGEDLASGLTRQGETVIAGFTARGTEAFLARMPLTPVLLSLLPLESAGARTAVAETAASGAGGRG